MRKQIAVESRIVPKRGSACIEPELMVTVRPPIGDEQVKQQQALVLLSQWAVRAAVRNSINTGSRVASEIVTVESALTSAEPDCTLLTPNHGSQRGAK